MSPVTPRYSQRSTCPPRARDAAGLCSERGRRPLLRLSRLTKSILLGGVGGFSHLRVEPFAACLLGRLLERGGLVGIDLGERFGSLLEVLEPIMKTRTRDQWVEGFTAAGVPCGEILEVEEVLSSDIVRARDMVTESVHPTLGTLQLPGVPVKLGDASAGIWRPPPRLGEHTDEVFAELEEGQG